MRKLSAMLALSLAPLTALVQPTFAGTASSSPRHAIVPLAGDRGHVVYVVANRNSRGNIVVHDYSIHVRDSDGDRRQLVRPRGVDLVHGSEPRSAGVIDIGLVHSTLEALVRLDNNRVRAYWWNVNNKSSHGSVLLPKHIMVRHDMLEVVPGGTAYAYKTASTAHPAGTIYKQAHDGAITAIARPYEVQTYNILAGDYGIVFIGHDPARNSARYMPYARPGKFTDLPLPNGQQTTNVQCDKPGRLYVSCRWDDRATDEHGGTMFMSVGGKKISDSYGQVDDAGLNTAGYDEAQQTWVLRTQRPDGSEVQSDPSTFKICTCDGFWTTFMLHGYDKVIVVGENRTDLYVVAKADDTPKRLAHVS